MPNFFYIDADNRKRGPVTPAQLKALAERGDITPNTPLVTDKGHKGLAGKIRGLFADSARAGDCVAAHPATQSSALSQSHDTPSSRRLTIIGICAVSLVAVIGLAVIVATPSSKERRQSAQERGGVSPPVLCVRSLLAVNRGANANPALWRIDRMHKYSLARLGKTGKIGVFIFLTTKDCHAYHT